MTPGSPGSRVRPERLVVPSDRRRLWIGLVIAVVGPIAITPVVRLEGFSTFPTAAYLLIVVAATLVGRLVAGAVAIVMSAVLLNLFFVAPVGGLDVLRTPDVWAIVVFGTIAAVVALILARLDRAKSTQTVERDRLSFLAHTGDVISGSLDVDTTLQRLGDALVPALADWFAVDLLEDGQIRNVIVVHPDPAKVELARALQRRFPTDPDTSTGAPAVIRTGRSELTERITGEMVRTLVPEPELKAAIDTLGLRCAMVVPLTARGRTFGAITLAGAEDHERYGPKDLLLAEEIADRAALAIDTARLLEAETRARAAATDEAHRNEVLKDVTAAFGRATTAHEVMVAMLEDGIRLAGARAATVGLVNEDDRVDLVGISGFEMDDHPYWHSFGLDERLPMSEAILERRPIVVSTTAERDRHYPTLAGRGEQRDHILVCLPLLLGDVAIGGFSASYPPGTAFGDHDVTFLRALGEQCAQAIDRARSVERERETRARFDALANVSRALARTLDFDATTATVVRQATVHLGAHARLYAGSGERLSLLAEAGGTNGTTAETPEGSGSSTGTPVGIAEAANARKPRLLDAEGTTGLPGVALPLVIADQTFGVLEVTDPSRDFRRGDELEFAREVARRMARALENARLYRERDYTARTLQESLLPPELPDVRGLEIEALFHPAIRGYEVGGDFYDVFETPSGRWAAVIGDVCGKGVEAATLTGIARHTLRAVSDVDRPSDALQALNRALLREHLDGRFCTVALALIEPGPDGARVQVAVGGHPLPLLAASDGHTRPVGRYGTLLGIVEQPRIEDAEVTLAPGHALVMFTDGIFHKHEALGDDLGSLGKVLSALPPVSAVEVRERVQHHIHDQIAGEQDDDIAVLVLFANGESG